MSENKRGSIKRGSRNRTRREEVSTESLVESQGRGKKVSGKTATQRKKKGVSNSGGKDYPAYFVRRKSL